MKPGIGLPNSDIDIRSAVVHEADAAEFIRDMIAAEMQATEGYITRHLGVSIYEGHVERWQNHMEVYAKLHEMTEIVCRNMVRPKRRRKRV